MTILGKKAGGEPLRTCLGCRKKQPQAAMRRLAVLETPGGPKVLSDPKRRLGGRGAWLCPGSACLALARRKKAFNRAFRVERSLDLSELNEEI